jgi:S1-C subfamily serine protease
MVLALNGATIAGADDLIRVLTGDKIGQSVTVEALRNGSRRSFSLTPSERVSRARSG